MAMIEISIKTTTGEELNIKIDGKEISTCCNERKEISAEPVTQVFSFNDSDHLWRKANVKAKDDFVPPPPPSKKKPTTVKSVMAAKKNNKKGRSK
jgi:hypothetical protein